MKLSLFKAQNHETAERSLLKPQCRQNTEGVLVIVGTMGSVRRPSRYL